MEQTEICRGCPDKNECNGETICPLCGEKITEAEFERGEISYTRGGIVHLFCQ